MAQDLGGATKTVEEDLDSTLESVDRAEHLALDVAREMGFEEDDLHKIGMSVRECLVNAVVHGNRYNRNKKVRFSVSRTPDKFRVRIADQGDGFAVHEIPDPLAEDNLLRQSGRGLFLMRAFMDEFVVHKLDPMGTEVILVKNAAAKK
ncbi:MAG: ATP-binding protein [Bryobacteraceae bacterium]